ncbi:MAG: hypothetical protein WDO74_11435 [Pseudomonadota bacterium]
MKNFAVRQLIRQARTEHDADARLTQGNARVFRQGTRARERDVSPKQRAVERDALSE